MYKKKKINKLERFINKCRKIYNNKFDYSLVNYIGPTTKVKIKCNEHNIIFEQQPAEHLRGKNSCNLCSKKPKVNTEYFINKAKEIHGDKYDYSKTEYIDSRIKVKIICQEHGEFEQLPNNHYKQNCPKCYLLIKNKDKKLNTEDFINKAKEIHGDKYDYSLVKYKDSVSKIKIFCPKHGEFEQQPYNHIRGKGCHQCAIEKRTISFLSNTEDFINKAKEIHDDKYDYSMVKYIGVKEPIKILCPEHGEFEQIPNYHLSGSGCQKCGLSYNKTENEIKNFIYGLKFNYIENSRDIITPLELDIFIPSHNLAIEYDGLYWHSELYKPSNYHLNKTLECEKKGIQLIHIFEDEWIYKRPIVESRLKNILGLTENKIYARKCLTKVVSPQETKIFLEENHIQGNVNSSIKLGLYYEDELVSLITFGALRKSMGSKSEEGNYELLRFCNKLNTSVIGGADKLLQYFIRTYRPKQIISYADRRWSTGHLYEKLGFTFIHESKPNYFYIINGKREYRFKYRKDILIKEGFDENKSEREIMFDRGIYRIYDCGSSYFRMIL